MYKIYCSLSCILNYKIITHITSKCKRSNVFNMFLLQESPKDGATVITSDEWSIVRIENFI